MRTSFTFSASLAWALAVLVTGCGAPPSLPPTSTSPDPTPSPVQAPSLEVGDCTDSSFHWSKTDPPVNRQHLFCGEINRRGKPVGFHSRHLLATSEVVTAIGQERPRRDGTYNAEISFVAPAQPRTKRSTFFPDTCSIEQIVRSVVHAANHPDGPHPQWGVLGPSAPANGAKDYCLANNGRPLQLRLGLLDNGRVNTAFPQ